MNRRKFLKISLPAALGTLALNGFSIKAFAANRLTQALSCEGIADRILVVVQLKGGNDGLNNLVPINQYDLYANLRPTVRIPESTYLNLDSGLSLDNQVGLHPAMSTLKTMYEQGKVNIVQGVGYINQNRSHFKGTDLWLTGGDGTTENYNIGTGWMGRYLAASYPGVASNPTSQMPDPLGIQLGDPKPSLGFHTTEEHAASINLSGQDPAGFYNLVSEIGGAAITNIPTTEYGDELSYIMGVEEEVSVYAQRITDVFNAGNNIATYPDYDLANQLRTIARLISGGSKTKIYLVQLGGFDTHNGQVQDGAQPAGIHATLLTTLCESIKAFQDDITALGHEDRVLTVTFSEFGRKARENGNYGTDHGTLAPMYVFGKGVEAGVSGTNVNLSDLADDFQLQYQQFDYRQVFTTILQDWLGASAETLEATQFEGFSDQKIPFINSNYLVSPDCYLTAIATDAILPQNSLASNSATSLHIYPNPARGTSFAQIQSPIYQDAHLQVLSLQGQIIRSYSVSLSEGQNVLPIDLHTMASGVYIVRAITANGAMLTSANKLTVLR